MEMEPFDKFVKRNVLSVARFAIVGFANTAVGLTVIYLLKSAATFGDVPANASGYAVGLSVSFVLNRKWTFGHSGPWIPAATRFCAVFAIAYLANLGTVILLVRRIGIDGYVAQAIGILPYSILFYVGSRLIAFRGASSEFLSSDRTAA